MVFITVIENKLGQCRSQSLLVLFFLIIIFLYVRVYHNTPVEVREQLVGFCSLLLSHGSQGSMSDHLILWLVPPPAEPPHQPHDPLFNKLLSDVVLFRAYGEQCAAGDFCLLGSFWKGCTLAL